MASFRVYSDMSSGMLGSIYKENTLYIDKSLDNPSVNDIKDILELTKYGIELNVNRIYRLLFKGMPTLTNTTLTKLSKEVLEMMPKDGNETSLKNHYTKLHFWFVKYFMDAFKKLENDIVTTVIFNSGKIASKYEMDCLYILYRIGLEVYVIGDLGQYAKYKEKYKILELIEAEKSVECSKKNIEGTSYREILEAMTLSDASYNTLIVGYDTEDNFEYFTSELYTKYKEDKDNFLIVEKGLVTDSTFQEFGGALLKYGDVKGIIGFVHNYILADEHRESIKIFVHNYLKDGLTTVKKRTLGYVLYWYAQYIYNANRRKLYDTLWLFNSIGKMNAEKELFLKLCCYLPLKFICIETNEDSLSNIEGLTVNKFNKFSKELLIAKFGLVNKNTTVAFDASQRMDELLYSNGDLGVYKYNMYKKSNVISLSTTVDEVFLLWDKENMFRPHFKSSSDSVDIPAIFMQIDGFDEKLRDDFYKLMTCKDTIIVDVDDNNCTGNKLLGARSGPDMCMNGIIVGVNMPDKSMPVAFGKDGLNRFAIKSSPNYKYSYLNKDTESLIFDKLNEMLSMNILNDSGMKQSKFIDKVINTTMNMSQHIINLIQSFDFTKMSPKLIVMQEGTSVLDMETAIICTLLHLIGFDVLILVPTKYRGAEQYVNRGLLQVVELIDANFNRVYSQIPKYKPKESLLGRLFGK